VVSYVITGNPVTDPLYDPYSDTIHLHDNMLGGTSDDPTGPLGFLLVMGMVEIMPAPVIVPDVVWDGLGDPAKLDGTGALMPQYKICIQNNGDADFVNLQFPLGEGTLPTRDATPHDCSHPPLPAVTLPGA
jgi:hypothetical protein